MAKKAPLERSALEKELFAQRVTEDMLARYIGRSTSYVSIA